MPEWKLALIRAAGQTVMALHEVASVMTPDLQPVLTPIIAGLITTAEQILDAVQMTPPPPPPTPTAARPVR